MEDFLDLINGTLLGDACIKFDNYHCRKYFSYKLTAKDESFLKWFGNKLKEFGIKYWITRDNRYSDIFALYFYINNSPYSKILLLSRSIWYKEVKNKSIKIVPRNLHLNPTILLHWYLGDGSLPRRTNDKNRIPTIVLATNCFSKKDINFLIEKLNELNLNFYPVKYKSGFTGKKCGYCLYSKTQDGTSFRFFKLIGLECPKEIDNCTTGSKGPGSKTHYFKDKWPAEDEWIRIISNVSGVGKIIKERRLELRISRKEINEKLDAGKDYLRKIEYGMRFPSVERFRKIMKILKLEADNFLNSENFK